MASAVAAACRYLALVLAVVAVSASGAASSNSKSLNISNTCVHTVWPAITSRASSAMPDTMGFELAPGQWETVAVPSEWSGRVWGRTLCSTDSSDNKFTCVTGDCGSGNMDCAGGNAAPPVTLAQFTLGGSGGGMDSYDVSLVDGFNLPMLVAPQGATAEGNCALAGCVVDLNAACPAELRATFAAGAGTGTGVAVACNSACLAFGSPQYCCTGEFGAPDACKPTAYSQLFKHACPRAYSYAHDGAGGSTCAGGDTCIYSITFCPSTTSDKTSTNPRSEPPGNGNLPLINGSSSTTPNTSGGTQPWQIGLVVAVFGVVAAALGLLAQFLGLFKSCCNSPTQGAGGAAGQHNPIGGSTIEMTNITYVGR